MVKRFLFCITLLLANFAEAQVCQHTSLSNNFDFVTVFVRGSDDGTDLCCQIQVFITAKNSKKSQEITISSTSIFKADFKDCNAVKSFATNVNKNVEVHDNRSGDFIVMDLNFDGLEDFAILSDSGGNGGPTYNFYIQDQTGTFIKDEYLTKTMEFFPLEIDKLKKTLTVYVHASAYDLRKTVFKYNAKYSSWEISENVLVGYDECPVTIDVKQ